MPSTPTARPVTHADPAGFFAGPMFTADRQPHPDYGCVFWTDQSDNLGRKYRLDFDRKGDRFCMCGPGEAPKSGWVVVQNRGFRVAGPSNRQIAADALKAPAKREAEAA